MWNFNLFDKIGQKSLETEKTKTTEKNKEENLKAIIMDQTDLICSFLPDGTLTYVNDSYCRYYGKSREALLGKRYFELVPTDIIKEDKEHLSNLTQKNPVVEVEHRAVDKNGWHRWQHWTTRAVFGKNNKLIEYQSVGRDITEQKYTEEALRKSEEEYRGLVDNSLVGVYRADLDGDYVYVNEAMANMFEFEDPEEMLRENARFSLRK